MNSSKHGADEQSHLGIHTGGNHLLSGEVILSFGGAAPAMACNGLIIIRLIKKTAFTLSVFVIFVMIVICFYGCSSNAQSSQSAVVVVEPNQKLSTAPNRFDVYRASSANKAIIFLHGGGGNKHSMAYQLGINYKDVDPNDLTANYDSVNDQVLLDNNILAVFPQGQTISSLPNAYTWSNWVMDSGQDDMQYIRDLIAYLSATYAVSRFTIAGHSSGGMMVNRVWCEAPELFERYVAIAGPPSEHYLSLDTPCTPSQVKPYLGIVGSADNILQTTGNWDDQTWTINPQVVTPAQTAFIDPIVIGERYMYSNRVMQKCGATVSDGDADSVTTGALTTWTFCSNTIQLIRVQSSGHQLQDLTSAAGSPMLGFIMDFDL